MRISAVSDLHGNLIDIQPCDLLLIAGDICPATDHSLSTQATWLDGPFRRWLERVPARQIVGVAGNHDFVFEQDPDRVPAGLRWSYLQDQSVTMSGLKVYGSPWQPWFYDWAFNLREPELERKWDLIPDDADILVFHGPPAGYGDLNSRGKHTGSPSQLEAIRRSKPRLAVFGHIHEARGQWTLDHDGWQTTLANVSVVNERYERVFPPTVFDLQTG